MAVKTKSINFIIPLVVYPFDLMVSIGEADAVLKKTLSNFGIEDEDSMWTFGETTKGRFCLFTTNQGLIRIKSIPLIDEDYANLQHEIFHYVMHVFDRIGMKWTAKSDEAYSYMIGYLTKEIYKKLK